MRTIDFLVLFICVKVVVAASCPPQIQKIAFKQFNFTVANGVDVDLSFCQPLRDICPSSIVCSTPNCCAVCEKWCANPAEICGACLGKSLARADIIGVNQVALLYIGGDPVTGADPGMNGPRQVWVNITADPRAGPFSFAAFVEPGKNPPPNRRDGDVWTYSITARSSSVSFGPAKCNLKDDCGACTTSAGCSYCLSSDTCIPTALIGKGCSGWVSAPGRCPGGECSYRPSCATCLTSKFTSCAWCLANDNGASTCVGSRLANPANCPGGVFSNTSFCSVRR